MLIGNCKTAENCNGDRVNNYNIVDDKIVLLTFDFKSTCRRPAYPMGICRNVLFRLAAFRTSPSGPHGRKRTEKSLKEVYKRS